MDEKALAAENARLKRLEHGLRYEATDYHDEMHNGFAEIARLRGEVERLRGALKTLAEPRDRTFIGDPWAFYDDMTAYARAALAEGDTP